MRRLAYILVGLWVMFSVGQAAAWDKDTVAAGVLPWVAAYLGEDAPEAVPPVTMVSERDLWIVARGDLTGFEERTPDNPEPPRYYALYNHDDGSIYMAASADLDNIYWLAALVHELVHHVQYKSGHHETAPCRNALERDAYAAQEAFLNAAGRSAYAEDDRPEKPLHLDRLFQLMAMTCHDVPFGEGSR